MSFIDTITIGLRTTEESCPSDSSTAVSIAFAFSKISTKTLSDHSQRVHHPVGRQNTTVFGDKCPVGVHPTIIQGHTRSVGHLVLTMSYAPYFTGTDLIGLWHELLAMYLTHSVSNEVLRE